MQNFATSSRWSSCFARLCPFFEECLTDDLDIRSDYTGGHACAVNPRATGGAAECDAEDGGHEASLRDAADPLARQTGVDRIVHVQVLQAACDEHVVQFAEVAGFRR